MRQALVLAATLAIGLAGSGCAPVAPIDTAAPAMQGRSASSITAQLGPPEIRRQSDGRTVYLWTSQTRAPATPEPSSRVSYASGRPNTIETMSYPDPPERESCSLRAVVDGAGQIVSSAWDGSKAGCYAMQQKLAAKV